MKLWEVVPHPDFTREFAEMGEDAREALIRQLGRLEVAGPRLARPNADTLAGSRHANMKELRFSAGGGEWRAAFAFDPVRRAVVLVAGDKSGVSQKRFYKSLVARADERFDRWLEAMT